jgi:hypothetical protein
MPKKTMTKKILKTGGDIGPLPPDLVQRAAQLYFDLGIDIITSQDRKGRCKVLQVPYELPTKGVRRFRLFRQGKKIGVQGLGYRPLRVRITPQQQRNILNLFARIDRVETSSLLFQGGPHHLLVRT